MQLQISPSESEIMRVIWQSDGEITVAPLLNELSNVGKQWKSNTVVTFLSRLVEKGLLTVEKKGRNNIYTAVMNEEEFRNHQLESFIKEEYLGNAKEFIKTFLEQSNLSLQDIDKSTLKKGEQYVQQLLSDRSKKDTNTNADEIINELKTEIASRKASINTKRKTIIQLEWEINYEERRINELNTLINKQKNIDK